jgi:hypothetical protein
MDPAYLPWIALALQLAGTLILLGGKNQKMKELEREADLSRTKLDGLWSSKLAVADYHRETGFLRDELDKLFDALSRRLDRLENKGER